MRRRRFSISWASDGRDLWVVHDSEDPMTERMFRTLLAAENYITRERAASLDIEVESA